jgi:hypothetical protein
MKGAGEFAPTPPPLPQEDNIKMSDKKNKAIMNIL